MLSSPIWRRRRTNPNYFSLFLFKAYTSASNKQQWHLLETYIAKSQTKIMEALMLWLVSSESLPTLENTLEFKKSLPSMPFCLIQYIYIRGQVPD